MCDMFSVEQRLFICCNGEKKKLFHYIPRRHRRNAAVSVFNPDAKRGWLVGETRLPSYPQNTRYPLHMRLCGPRGPSGWVRKISPHRGSNPGTPKSATSRYTEYVISAHVHLKYFYKVPVIGGKKLP